MRGVTQGDLRIAACHLRRLAEAERPARLAAILAGADLADRFRKRLGRVHPCWGDGTLAAAVPRDGSAADEPFLSDPDYLRALAQVIAALLERQARGKSLAGPRRGLSRRGKSPILRP